MSDAKRLWLMGLLALWLMAWSYSFVVLGAPAPVDAGLPWPETRLRAFLGWQAVAALPAFAAWGLGLGWPRGAGVRRVAAWPIRLALLLGLAMAAAALWPEFSQLVRTSP